MPRSRHNGPIVVRSPVTVTTIIGQLATRARRAAQALDSRGAIRRPVRSRAAPFVAVIACCGYGTSCDGYDGPVRLQCQSSNARLDVRPHGACRAPGGYGFEACSPKNRGSVLPWARPDGPPFWWQSRSYCADSRHSRLMLSSEISRSWITLPTLLANAAMLKGLLSSCAPFLMARS
jgi:hypothetical protein